MLLRKQYLPLVFLVLSVGLASAHPVSSEQEVFEESIGVEIINIDVVVTDKKGRAVQGLTAADFELRVDGQQVPIANFYALSGGSTKPAPSIETDHAAPPTMPVEPMATPRYVVVYFDSLYLTPRSREHVLKDLPTFFEQQVQDGTQIMLITHDPASRVLTPFTNDLGELARGLKALEDLPAIGLRHTTSYRSALNGVNEIYQKCDDNERIEPCRDCLGNMVQIVRSYGLGLLGERREAMAALGHVINALSVLDGKKALLHVSDGIEQQTGVDLFYYLGEQLCPAYELQMQEHYQRQDVGDLNEVVNQANASRVTLYALEAAGIRNFSSASAEVSDARFRPSSRIDMAKNANLQGTLFYLADETGGKAVLNTTQFAADLGKLTDEIRSYYSMGYPPGHIGRGRSHRVSVKLTDGKRHTVRYRRSFLHKKPEQQLADRAFGSVMFGVSENPLAVVVQAVPQGEGSEGRRVISLDVAVPVDKLTLIPGDNGRRGRLTAIIAAPNENGKKTVIRRKQIDVLLPLENSQEFSGVYRFGVNVELAPGEYRLGVGIWDEIAAAGSFLGLPVEVQRTESAASMEPVESE